MTGDFIRPGTRAYGRVVLAIVAVGFSTFAIMNAVQPLMPLFSADFEISPATASLSLSVTIAALAVAMLGTAGLSDRLGRKRVMAASLWLSSLSMLATALTPGWPALLALRVVSGLAIAGVPAVAIAYIAEEIAPEARARANGIYVSGAALGGMAGRVIAAGAAEVAGWQGAMVAVGLLGLLTALAFGRLLPAPRNFTPRHSSLSAQVGAFLGHLAVPDQRRLYLIGFLLMGCLVAIYNYLSYRLVAPPFGLSTSVVGALFGLYVTGMASAGISGRLATAFGTARSLRGATLLALAGVLGTVPDQLWSILAGLTCFTIGFFAAHALASGAATRIAAENRAQAASLYLLSYYAGGAIFGWLFGYIWQHAGWGGVSAGLALLLLCVLALVPRALDRQA